MSQFSKSPFSFKAPSKFNVPSKFNNKDALFNKKKISNEVLSMSSASSSCSSSGSSRSGTTSSSNDDKHYDNDQARSYDEDDDDEVESEMDNDNDDEEDGNEEYGGNAYDKYENYQQDKKKSLMNELNEKRDLLYQMDRLESKGYKLPFKFNMESDIDEMKAEYNKLIKEKEIDASIRFQRKMLMAFVTGSEYLNTRYDPFSIRLEGWSEQVHENILDYDDIFEELHLKYKSTGKKMSPELRLFISLSGSAFMFHLTNRMFKENPLPNVENVLKSNPELMKQFQQAAAKQYITGNTGPQPRGPPQQDGGLNSGLFGMVSNMFNNLSGGPSRPKMYRDDDEASEASVRKYNKPRRDIDSIINNVHSKISFDQEQNNIETLSVSDEEITSIIEDTADIKILKNTKGNKNTRTLNL
jgi:hypothetical protein